MKPEDIKNKKIAVLCDTYEKAKSFCDICIDNKMSSALANMTISLDLIEGNSCICLKNESVYKRNKHWCEANGYQVITFEEFIGEATEEPPLTAEEVVEVLLREYYFGKYIEIFGSDYNVGDLAKKSPSEIVQKITEWKRKQDKQIRVTEDMIADALDEKYGVGNWGRE